MIPTKEQIELLQKNLGRKKCVIFGTCWLEVIVTEWEKLKNETDKMKIDKLKQIIFDKHSGGFHESWLEVIVSEWEKIRGEWYENRKRN